MSALELSLVTVVAVDMVDDETRYTPITISVTPNHHNRATLSPNSVYPNTPLNKNDSELMRVVARSVPIACIAFTSEVNITEFAASIPNAKTMRTVQNTAFEGSGTFNTPD